jgi:hypothetical protein
MKIETKIKTINDGVGSAKQEISIQNNTVHPDRVILKCGDFEVQVLTKELLKGIQNATI